MQSSKYLIIVHNEFFFQEYFATAICFFYELQMCWRVDQCVSLRTAFFRPQIIRRMLAHCHIDSALLFFFMGCFSFCFDDCWMSLRKPFSSTPFHKRNRDGRRSKILPTFLLSSVPWFLWHLNLIPNEKKENFHHFLFIVDEENDSCIIGCITVQKQ